MLADIGEVVIDRTQLKALSSDTRLEILRLLKKRRYTVSELAKKLNYSKSTMHEHIRKLEESGLIERVNSGYAPKWVYYQLTNKGMQLFDKTKRIVLVLAGFFIILAFVQLAALLFQNFYSGVAGDVVGTATQIREHKPLSKSTSEAIKAPAKLPEPQASESIETKHIGSVLIYGIAACLSVALILFLYAALRPPKIMLRRANK